MYATRSLHNNKTKWFSGFDWNEKWIGIHACTVKCWKPLLPWSRKLKYDNIDLRKGYSVKQKGASEMLTR